MSSVDEMKKGADAVKSVLVTGTAALTLFAALFAGYAHIDSKYALAEDVEKLEEKLTLSELKSSLRLAIDELNFLKSQHRKYPDDEDIKKELEEAQEHVDDLKERIKDLEKKSR